VDGDEIPLAGRDVLERLKLLLHLKLAVERLDLDAKKITEELGHLHAMGDPGRGRANFDRRRAVALLRQVIREDAEVGNRLRRGHARPQPGEGG